MSSGVRPDLLEGLLQACWLIERGRAAVLRDWSGEFEAQSTAASERAAMVATAMAERGIERPDHVEEAHAGWFRGLAGPTPSAVPLGPAAVQRFALWTDMYAEVYVDDPERFRDLGRVEYAFPVPPRDLTRDEAALEPREPAPGRRVVILTDIHIGAEGRGELAERAVEEINALAPEAVLVPGDVTECGEPEEFAEAKEVLDRLDVGVHVVLGNHDAVQRSTREPVGARLFEAAFGSPPRDVIVEVGPLQIALVDSSDPTPAPFPDWDMGAPDFRKESAGVASGAIGPAQRAALRDGLDPDRPTLLVMHHELQPFPGFPPVMFGVRRGDSDALLGDLEGHRLCGVLAGHTHRSALLEVGGGVRQLEVPSLRDWPHAYTVLGVTEDAVTATVHQIGDPDLVWARSRRMPPVYLNHVVGPLADLACALPLG